MTTATIVRFGHWSVAPNDKFAVRAGSTSSAATTSVAAVRSRYTSRFHSVNSAPWQERANLRERLAVLRKDDRRLEERHASTQSAGEWAADEFVLQLIQLASLSPDPCSPTAGERAIAGYAAGSPHSEVSWARLVEERWVRIVWGRWYLPYGLPNVPRADQSALGKEVIAVLLRLREAASGGRELVVPNWNELLAEHAKRHPSTPNREKLVEGGIVVERDGRVIVSPNSDVLNACGAWIAARLWDRTEFGPVGAARLSWWRDLVLHLGIKWFDFGDQLSTRSKETFGKLAWARIADEEDLVGWPSERIKLAAHIAGSSGFGDLEQGLAVVQEEPRTDPVSQLLWVERASHANVNQHERGDIGMLISILFQWRSMTGRGPFEEWTRAFAEAARTRPYLLLQAHYAMGRDPVNASDFLLVPEMAAFALCSLGARVELPQSFDREQLAERSRETESVWRDVAESGVSSLFALSADEAVIHLEAMLVRFAGQAQLGADSKPSRHAVLAWRYHLVRRLVSRWPQVHSTEQLALDSLGENVVEKLRERLTERERQLPLEAAAFELLCWLAAFGADTKSPWRPRALTTTVDVFRASFDESINWSNDVPLDSETWVRIAEWLFAHDPHQWNQLLLAFPLDVPQGKRRSLSLRHSLVHKARTHASLLLTIAGNWATIGGSTPMPTLFEVGLCALIKRWLGDDGFSETPSLFDAEVDVENFYQLPRPSLLVALARALPSLSAENHASLRDAVLEAVAEVRQLATFHAAATTDVDREAVKKRLDSLPVHAGTDDDDGGVAAFQRTVVALVDIGEISRAEVWLHEGAEKMRALRVPGWSRWEVSIRQRIRLARQQYSVAADASLPDWASGDFEARRANDFLRGVAMIHIQPSRATEAVEVFERLNREAPLYPAYAVNLFAAKTQQILQERKGPAPLSLEDRASFREVLADGESLLGGFTAEQRAEVEETYQANRLYIFHALQDWPALLAAYQSLPESTRRDRTLASFAAVALESSGQPTLAEALRTELNAPTVPEYLPEGVRSFDHVAAMKQALSDLSRLTMHDQARAWWGTELCEGLVMTLVNACGALVHVAPALAQPISGAPHEEDRVTALLAALLQQHVEKLGWHVHSQRHAGYTGKPPETGRGGIGEVDLEILAGSHHVAVGEAVTVKSFDGSVLREHFSRMFGYSSAGTPMMFFLIWSYTPSPLELWKRYLGHVPQAGSPPANSFQRWITESKGPTSDVWWATSEHAHPASSTCRVTHVLVDLHHHARRAIRMQGPSD